jgi:putative ABC transport system permease protein
MFDEGSLSVTGQRAAPSAAQRVSDAFEASRMTLLIAWRNLVHDRIRFAITLIGIAFSTILSGIQLGMLLNFMHTVSIIVDNAGADIWITAEGTPSVDTPGPLQLRRRFQALTVDGVAAAESFMLHFAYLSRTDGVRQIVIVVGAEPNAEMGLPFSLESSLNVRDVLSSPDSVLVDRLYAKKLGVRKIGETFEINGHRFRVGGFTHGVRTFTQAPYVFMSLANARSLFYPPDNDITHVLVRVADGFNTSDVAAALSARMPGVEVLTSTELAERSQYYWLVTTGAGLTLISSTLLAIFVGIVIVAQTLYASTMDRLPEYAVIRAMGGPRSYLFKIIIQQAVLGGLFGVTIGLAVIAVIVFFTQELNSRPEVPLWLAFGIVVTTIVMCVTASLGSISKVMTIDPVKVFR